MINSNSFAGNKRKCASEINDTSSVETESNKRQKLGHLPEPVSDICSAEVGGTDDLDQDQNNNSDSSLHVDLEQWC